MRLFQRLLASAVAGLAIQPITQAAPPTSDATVEVDQDSEARVIAEHPMMAQSVRAEYLAAYAGPKTFMSPELLAAVSGSRRFRNACLSGNEEFDRFVEARMK